MMSARHTNHDALLLLAPDSREWVPPGHLVLDGVALFYREGFLRHCLALDKPEPRRGAPPLRTELRL